MLIKTRRVIALSLAVLVGGFIQSANADYSINQGKLSVKHKQDIVVTLQSSPDAGDIGLEAACLSVTFARMLSDNPEHNVTLFVTLEGVKLANDQTAALSNYCTTPWEGKDGITLRESLNKYLDAGTAGDVVVCPICWKARFGADSPDYGVLPGVSAPGNAIGTMIGNADKILDF